MEFLLEWVTNYGYAAIFGLLVLGIVGLPVPDETMLVFCGYLIWRGNLKLIPTVIVAFVGSICGITISYLIGRTLGLGFVHKWGRYIHVTEARLDRVHQWFNRIGHWALFVGYYIAGVRHFTAIIAGTSMLEYRAFASYAYSGAALWVCTFLTIGYVFGEHWHEVIDTVHRHVKTASILLLAAVVAYVLIRRYRTARNGPATLESDRR
jgi:membrane protein DedA with SNARE-associated domain